MSTKLRFFYMRGTAGYAASNMKAYVAEDFHSKYGYGYAFPHSLKTNMQKLTYMIDHLPEQRKAGVMIVREPASIRLKRSAYQTALKKTGARTRVQRAAARVPETTLERVLRRQRDERTNNRVPPRPVQAAPLPTRRTVGWDELKSVLKLEKKKRQAQVARERWVTATGPQTLGIGNAAAPTATGFWNNGLTLNFVEAERRAAAEAAAAEAAAAEALAMEDVAVGRTTILNQLFGTTPIQAQATQFREPQINNWITDRAPNDEDGA